MSDLALALSPQHRRYLARRQGRRAVRGLVLAGLFAGALLGGLLPVPPQALPPLLALTAAFAGLRLLRGLWAVRVARHRVHGWRARHGGPGWRTVELSAEEVARAARETAPESADRRALRLLTEGQSEPLLERAREHGLALVDRLGALRKVLTESELSRVLERPVAEELARTEAELEALVTALGELSRAEGRQRSDLLERLAARLEVDGTVEAGLYAPA